MKIKMLHSKAGHANPSYRLADFSFPPGVVIDVDPVLARAWIDAKSAIAADKSDRLTMPVEVYTLPEQQAQGEPIDYKQAALFLQSRGYKTKTPGAAKTFIDEIDRKDLAGFMSSFAEFQDRAGSQPAPETPAEETQAALPIAEAQA